MQNPSKTTNIFFYLKTLLGKEDKIINFFASFPLNYKSTDSSRKAAFFELLTTYLEKDWYLDLHKNHNFDLINYQTNQIGEVKMITYPSEVKTTSINQTPRSKITNIKNKNKLDFLFVYIYHTQLKKLFFYKFPKKILLDRTKNQTRLNIVEWDWNETAFRKYASYLQITFYLDFNLYLLYNPNSILSQIPNYTKQLS